NSQNRDSLNMKAAILILSDKGAAGQREDASGPAIRTWLATNGVETIITDIIPDDFPIIQRKLATWCDVALADLVITCGGTGVSPRDVTPEATKSIIEKELVGFGELMRQKSLAITPMAILSRGTAGIRNNCLIINLPGSPKAAVENLAAVWPAIDHGVAKIKGDPSDCAGIHLPRKGSPPVVSFAGYSGSGKTTLVTEVIKQLTGQGYKVGAIKHDGHSFEIDRPGKDSWKMTQAGSAITCITDSSTLAMIKNQQCAPSVDSIVSDYYSAMDIVIVEGWKESAPNKIEVYRSEVGYTPLSQQENAENFIAIATDCDLQSSLPLFDINQPQKITNFIVESYLQPSQQHLH
ncbi:molybdopterin-guanine dinucleotide biosynthesis protein B, partial [Malonomonas rubra]|uniref:molybdopterin-guanine dinucleotide biosynthesis protein B n=1 Tax=Malonomonas rubra TaxID=57040 RepID=UPI0026EF20E2